MPPSFPPDEDERRALLASLDLLDTDAEEVFDRITRLVSRLLKVPIALFTLVDTERQWFKSRVGMDVSETPREHAFCAHAILQDQPLIVHDASLDARFADNPLVTGDPHIRFYAGVPIRSSGGLAVGTLCAIDRDARVLTADELCIMIDLADVVQKEVQHRERVAAVGRHLMGASEARFRSIFDLASIGIALVSPTGGWLSVNNALCRIVGYAPDEMQRLTFQDITHPDDLELDIGLLGQLRDGEIEQYQLEKRYIHKDGRIVWINLNVSKKTNGAGQIEYYIAVIKEIGAQKEAEAALAALHADLEARVAQRTAELRERETELRSVIENANDAYIGLDQEGRVTVWNRAAEQTFGFAASETIGLPLERLIIPPELAGAHQGGMLRNLSGQPSTVLGKRLELPAVRKDGSRLMVEVRINALEVRGQRMFSAFLHDISERKQLEAAREYETRHDLLTGLPNRRALQETLPVAQSRATRSGRSLALLFIDLDGFKAVNDSFGHEAGDRLLCETAARLRTALRKTDSVFRLAGDEFTVLLECLADSEADAHTVAHKIVDDLARPVAVEDGSATVGASIGLAVFTPGSRATAADLLREADQRMYQAKRAGKGQVFPQRS
ncbi:PAS domain S-box protein [Massilia sp. Dwa41.01b]|uniref:PAS domain S-box protein n=1 Tax=unclassified Massilia TaxID=2609279 RepID=UPI001603FCCE|nr:MULTISPECIES: PAS domain S-box protein [unclassified Massilia]QNA88276.1 PAS domain S-box protein [Massilia sp. Dwa41.01b]QNA99178.1 PAS domain S-box protein [Massilia sp. Se16.2.3]